MDAFEYAYRFTRKEEGGYSHDKRDTGGPTQKGMSEQTFLDAQREGLVDRSLKKVKDIKDSDAKKVLREMFWNKIRGDEMPLDVAVVLFDTAVNFYPERAIGMLQKILKVKQDRIMGPETLEGIKNYQGNIVEDLLKSRLQAHENRVKESPVQRAFLSNWRGRTSRLGYYVGKVLPYYLYYGLPKSKETPTDAGAKQIPIDRGAQSTQRHKKTITNPAGSVKSSSIDGLNIAPPSLQGAAPIRPLGPSPSPLYTGSRRPTPVRNGQIPVGIGLGPYAPPSDTHIRFDLPGTLGAGEWLRNKLSPEIPPGGPSLPAVTSYPGDGAPLFPEPLPLSSERGFGNGPEAQTDQLYGMFPYPASLPRDTGEAEGFSSEYVLRKPNRLAGANGLPWPWLS